ncbi:MAG: hypothetical protein SD837_16300 [Candidatus Electrothrix scaldis]|nr:MAG: hypothetical protein SD837_16300 [Candidatus Electrothrix sp. GW3-3]
MGGISSFRLYLLNTPFETSLAPGKIREKFHEKHGIVTGPCLPEEGMQEGADDPTLKRR